MSPAQYTTQAAYNEGKGLRRHDLIEDCTNTFIKPLQIVGALYRMLQVTSTPSESPKSTEVKMTDGYEVV